MNPPTGKSGNFGKFRLVIAPLGSNRSWSASVFVGCLRGAATETDAAKWSSLSQRERAGEREKGGEVSVDRFAPGLRGRSPSPAGRGDDGGRAAKRGQGVGCPPSRRLPQSQRDCGLQPRVARNELPWVMAGKIINPNGVAALLCQGAATPLGLWSFGRVTQGSAGRAPLGWRPESRWDSAKGCGGFGGAGRIARPTGGGQERGL